MTSRQWLVLLITLVSVNAHATTLTIVSESWPPYVYEEQGQMKGADYDITQHVLSKLGYTTQWHLMPWRRALYDTANGHADAVLDISPTLERQEQYIYPSEPLSRSESVLFYNKLHPHPFSTLQDLSGLNIGVSAGYRYGNPAFIAADNFNRVPASSNETSMQMLMRGRVDMVIMNKRVGQFVINELGFQEQIAHHTTVVSGGPLFLAFQRRPDLAELATRFTASLRTFKHSSEYTQILRQYGLTDFKI